MIETINNYIGAFVTISSVLFVFGLLTFLFTTGERKRYGTQIMLVTGFLVLCLAAIIAVYNSNQTQSEPEYFINQSGELEIGN